MLDVSVVRTDGTHKDVAMIQIENRTIHTLENTMGSCRRH